MLAHALCKLYVRFFLAMLITVDFDCHRRPALISLCFSGSLPLYTVLCLLFVSLFDLANKFSLSLSLSLSLSYYQHRPVTSLLLLFLLAATDNRVSHKIWFPPNISQKISTVEYKTLKDAFLHPEGGSQKATLVIVLLLVGICSLRVQKSQDFLNMQRIATKLCIYIRADIAHRSTVSDFPLIL